MPRFGRGRGYGWYGYPGFWVATVDKKGCISCGLCTSLPEHMHDYCVSPPTH